MSRVHFWAFLKDEEGRPLPDADLALYEANTKTNAIIFASRAASASDYIDQSTWTTNSSGFFSFYIGDEYEDVASYPNSQKFDLTWYADITEGSTILTETFSSDDNWSLRNFMVSGGKLNSYNDPTNVIVENGSMESLSDWTAQNGASIALQVGVGVNGSNCYRITANTGDNPAIRQVLTQNYTLTIGETYRVTFYVKAGTNDQFQAYMRSPDNTKVGITTTQKATSEWVQHDFYFTVWNSIQQLWLVSVDSAGSGLTLFFDEVDVRRVDSHAIYTAGSPFALSNRLYRADFDVENYVHGTLEVSAAIGSLGNSIHGNGTKSLIFQPTQNLSSIRIEGTDFTGKIDNFTITQITSDATGTLEDLQPFIQIFAVDETSQDTDVNKTISNQLAYDWEDHIDNKTYLDNVHGIYEVDTTQYYDSTYDKAVSNLLMKEVLDQLNTLLLCGGEAIEVLPTFGPQLVNNGDMEDAFVPSGYPRPHISWYVSGAPVSKQDFNDYNTFYLGNSTASLAVTANKLYEGFRTNSCTACGATYDYRFEAWVKIPTDSVSPTAGQTASLVIKCFDGDHSLLYSEVLTSASGYDDWTKWYVDLESLTPGNDMFMSFTTDTSTPPSANRTYLEFKIDDVYIRRAWPPILVTSVNYTTGDWTASGNGTYYLDHAHLLNRATKWPVIQLWDRDIGEIVYAANLQDLDKKTIRIWMDAPHNMAATTSGEVSG